MHRRQQRRQGLTERFMYIPVGQVEGGGIFQCYSEPTPWVQVRRRGDISEKRAGLYYLGLKGYLGIKHPSNCEYVFIFILLNGYARFLWKNYVCQLGLQQTLCMCFTLATLAVRSRLFQNSFAGKLHMSGKTARWET